MCGTDSARISSETYSITQQWVYVTVSSSTTWTTTTAERALDFIWLEHVCTERTLSGCKLVRTHLRQSVRLTPQLRICVCVRVRVCEIERYWRRRRSQMPRAAK